MRNSNALPRPAKRNRLEFRLQAVPTRLPEATAKTAGFYKDYTPLTAFPTPNS
jgi:hypothetical protein